MREVTHTTTLPFDAHTVFDWFKNLDENYIQWHPIAHQQFEWLTQKPIGEGTLFYFVENIKGHQHKITMRIAEYKEDIKLSFAMVKIQVYSKYLPIWFLTILSSLFQITLNITHQFEANTPESVTIITRQTTGSHLPVFGVLVDWVLELLVFPSQDQQSHVAEEWEYIERELASRRK
ncbi:MAG: hypothetical protein NTV01_07360 [Bacteroidia bacterium]|nr:hypothetical protein [Bacteroidia bacterium]